MRDDVPMNAMAGSIAERTRAIFAAGCDMVMPCNGKLDEMRQVAAETPELSGKALERARRALASRRAPQAFDRLAARAELDALVDRAGMAGALAGEIFSFKTGGPPCRAADGPAAAG